MNKEELTEAFDKLQRRGFVEHELKEILVWLQSGRSPEMIMLADKYVQQRRGKRDFRSMDRMLLTWEKNGWKTVEEIRKRMDPILYEERIVSLLRFDRKLTAQERRYISRWNAMEMEDQVIVAAYERTCLNTGGLNWAYMDKILQLWNANGYRTMEDLRNAKTKNSYQPTGKDAEIQRLKEENRKLLLKVSELQEALLKEKEKVNRLLEEKGE